MKKNKRSVLFGVLALILLLVLVLVVYLVSGQNRKQQLPQIGLCFRQYDENTAYCSLLRQTLSGAGYEVHVADAVNDQSRQTAQIEEMIRKGCALLVVEPVMVSTSQQLVAQVKAAQIPTVFVNYELEGDALDQWDKLCYVGCQEQQHGILQARTILQTANKGDINEDGTVSCLVISGPEEDRNAQLQASGCIRALQDAGLTVSLLETKWGQWTQDSGRKLCADALAQYGKDIEVIFCGNDDMALGALEAVRSGGWKVGEDYYLTGIGGTEEVLQAIQMGNMTGTVAEDLKAQAQQVLAAAQAMLAGETVEKRYYVNCAIVTQENVESYLPQ